jgi:hypothetical protein
MVLRHSFVAQFAHADVSPIVRVIWLNIALSGVSGNGNPARRDAAARRGWNACLPRSFNPPIRTAVSPSHSATCPRRSPKAIRETMRCCGRRTRSNRRSPCMLPPRSRCRHRRRRRQTRSWCLFRPWGWRKPHCTKQGAGRAELAHRLRWRLPQVNRVLDLRHPSRMEHLEAALAALGLRLIIECVAAPSSSR